MAGSPLLALTEEAAPEPNERHRRTLVLDTFAFTAVFVGDENFLIPLPTSVGKTAIAVLATLRVGLSRRGRNERAASCDLHCADEVARVGARQDTGEVTWPQYTHCGALWNRADEA